MDEFGLIAQMNVFLNAVAFRVAADGISVHRNLPNGVTRPPWGGLLSHPEWPGAARPCSSFAVPFAYPTSIGKKSAVEKYNTGHCALQLRLNHRSIWRHRQLDFDHPSALFAFPSTAPLRIMVLPFPHVFI